jgi:hypothetical protein
MKPDPEFIDYLDPTVRRNRVASPDAPVVPQEPALALPTLGALAGKTVVFLDNGWKSFGRMTHWMERTLRDRFGVAEVKRQYISSSTPMPASVLERVLAESDLAIVGMAN